VGGVVEKRGSGKSRRWLGVGLGGSHNAHGGGHAPVWGRFVLVRRTRWGDERQQGLKKERYHEEKKGMRPGGAAPGSLGHPASNRKSRGGVRGKLKGEKMPGPNYTMD